MFVILHPDTSDTLKKRCSPKNRIKKICFKWVVETTTTVSNVFFWLKFQLL